MNQQEHNIFKSVIHMSYQQFQKLNEQQSKAHEELLNLFTVKSNKPENK